MTRMIVLLWLFFLVTTIIVAPSTTTSFVFPSTFCTTKKIVVSSSDTQRKQEQEQQKLHSTNAKSSTSTSAAAATTTTSSSAVGDFVGTPSANELFQLAEDFVYKKSGFYSPVDETAFSNEFVFRGPIVGPLNKEDYIRVMDTFQIYNAIPDINPNAFGYSIDPIDPYRVWFLVRNTGTFTGEDGLGLGYGLKVPSNGKSIDGCVETFSIVFDENKKVKHITVGYVADRFIGNTGGYGAAFGIFHAIGLPLPKDPFLRTFQYIASEIMNTPAKTYSTKNIPAWWTNPWKASDGM